MPEKSEKRDATTVVALVGAVIYGILQMVVIAWWRGTL